MRLRHAALLVAVLAALVWLGPAFAQEVDFHAPGSTSDPQLAAIMRDLPLRSGRGGEAASARTSDLGGH